MNRFSLHEAAIDTGRIRENARRLIATAGAPVGCAVVADIRADGYGHGAVPSARAALDGGATWLGISAESDATELRDAGIDAPVAVIARRGARPTSDGPVGGPGSGAIVLGPSLYGIVAGADERPAMRVSARVVAVKTIDAGEGVSYGHTFRAASRTNLALVAIGYANGLDRFASNAGTLMLRGKPRLIAGRVAMNVAVLELGGDNAEIGDEAVLFGDPVEGAPSIADWSAGLGKKPEEVASVLGAHLPRSYR